MGTCLVVGAGDGIGAAVARRFAEEGFVVGLVARDRARLERLADTVAGPARVAAADAGDATALGAALSTLQEATGPADVLVYNVARGEPGPAGMLAPGELAAALAVDVVGAVAATQAVLPAMRRRGTGTLLFTGGGLALHPAGAAAALSIGKAAIRALSLALHQDLAPHGVHAATVTVKGLVKPGTRFDPDAIAAVFWALHVQRAEEWDAERVFD